MRDQMLLREAISYDMWSNPVAVEDAIILLR